MVTVWSNVLLRQCFHSSQTRSLLSSSQRHNVFLRTGSLSIRLWSTQRNKNATAASSVSTLAPRSWVDALPTRARPYVLLARADKPIGTLLLFYPCGEYILMSCQEAVHRLFYSSMVYYNGLVCSLRLAYCTGILHMSLWDWGFYNERCWVHD